MRFTIKKIQALVIHPQIIFVFFAFALMASLSSWFMNNIIRTHLAYNAEVVLDALEAQIEVDMLEPRTVLGNLTQTVHSMILDGATEAMIYRYLKEITDYILLDDKQLLGFSSIYGFFNSLGGVFIDSMDREPPENYNPSERPWYIDAAATGGSIVFLQPYADIVTGTVIITYARALYDNEGNILGVIALDLQLDRISEYIINTNFGKMGYGFLLSEQMEILTHPNIDLLGIKLRLLNSDFAALEDKLRQEHVITESRLKNIDGDISVFFIRQLENGWYIGIVTPEGVYYRELARIRLILIILGIILASILSTILYNIAAMGKKADERTRIMLDATPLCANFWDRNLNHIDCNREAVKMFGLSSKREYSERFFDLSPEYQPDGRLSGEKAVELVRKAFDEGYSRFEWMHQKLNGEQVPCEITLVRVEYNDDFMVAGYTRDLRELKTVITQMEESEQSLSTLENILNGLDAMIYVTVPETGEVLFMNDNMKKHYNIKDDCIGQLCFKILQEGLDQKCDFCPCYQLDKDPDSTVVWEEHSTLTKRIYRNTDRYIEWPNGTNVHIQSSIDVTEFIAAKEQAEQSSRFKSQFLSRMSHEIRTPMNAILGITEIQLQDEKHDQGTIEALSRIHNSGYLLLGIINDILDLSKIEAGKLELIPVSYDVPSLINDTVYLNVMRYDSTHVEFKLQVDENLPLTLFGDELRIKQILNNLLSNAFKYTEEGEISMSVTAERQKEEMNITLVFRITDTGQGLNHEQIEKLFDDYSRFNMEANRATEGTGLGMSITRQLILMMNGEILVESEHGKGSAFTVRLPQIITGSGVLGKEAVENLLRFNTGRSSHIEKTSQIAREYMPYGRILIVDDVETNLYVAKGLMIPYGLEIETAVSGFETIDKIKNGAKYDIIFMDHFMPKMDGIEAARILRDLGYTHPIVALTANALTGQSEMFMENGFDGFISKPIDIRQLNYTLNRLIRDKYPPEVINAAREHAANLAKPSAEKVEPLSNPELAAIFTRDAEKAITRLKTIFANAFRRKDDIRQYVIDVHSMKSALANIGESDLSAIAYNLEQAGRSENIDVMKEQTQSFLSALRQVIEKNKPQEDNGYEVHEESEYDRKYFNEKLMNIQKACEEYDVINANSALTGLKQRKWSPSSRKLLETISEYLLHSDFEEAAELIKELLRDKAE